MASNRANVNDIQLGRDIGEAQVGGATMARRASDEIYDPRKAPAMARRPTPNWTPKGYQGGGR